MIQYRCRAVPISSPLRMPAITAPPLAPPASRGRLVRDRPSKRTTPPERNMIARRRWFRYWAPQITQRGYVWDKACQGSKGRPGATPDGLSRDCRLSICRFRRKDFRGGPTRDAIRTTHVGPNQTAGPTAWPNRIYANFVAKTARLDAKARSRAGAAGGSKCRARGFRAPYRCLSPCDESLLWAGSISTIVHS